MTDLANEAVVALTTVVNGMVGAASPEGVLITPTRIHGTGIGGFVAPNADPPGDIEGALVEAVVRVSVEATDLSALNTASAQVMSAMLSPTTAQLRDAGLLRVGVEEGDGGVRDAGGNRIGQDVRFRVLFEFLRIPEEGGGIIREIPLRIAAVDPDSWLDLSFTPASLAWFQVVDDPRATTDTPSAWGVDAARGVIVQGSTIRGGPNTATANKPGTYLLLRPRPDVPPLRDFRLRTTVRSRTQGGVGLVFRYRGPDDFYFFHMDSAGFRMIAKKVGDAFSQLATPALDAANGFSLNADHALELRVSGPEFSVALDGVEILAGEDTDLVGAGRVGFATRRTLGASFAGLTLLPP